MPDGRETYMSPVVHDFENNWRLLLAPERGNGWAVTFTDVHWLMF